MLTFLRAPCSSLLPSPFLPLIRMLPHNFSQKDCVTSMFWPHIRTGFVSFYVQQIRHISEFFKRVNLNFIWWNHLVRWIFQHKKSVLDGNQTTCCPQIFIFLFGVFELKCFGGSITGMILCQCYNQAYLAWLCISLFFMVLFWNSSLCMIFLQLKVSFEFKWRQ